VAIADGFVTVSFHASSPVENSAADFASGFLELWLQAIPRWHTSNQDAFSYSTGCQRPVVGRPPAVGWFGIHFERGHA
jgi:hypothetical protein